MWLNEEIVFFAAVIRVVTQRTSPLKKERCVTTLITAGKETNEETDYLNLVK